VRPEKSRATRYDRAHRLSSIRSGWVIQPRRSLCRSSGKEKHTGGRVHA